MMTETRAENDAETVQEPAGDVEAPSGEAKEQDAPVKRSKRKGRPAKDRWSDGGEIPSGATGPTVRKLRRNLGLDSGETLDRRATLKVRAFQRAAGLPETGRVDKTTRARLGI